jgi:hypothetical protein
VRGRDAQSDGAQDGIVLEEIVTAPRVEVRPRADFAARAFAFGPAGQDDADVYLPRRVLAEILEQARAAGDMETGGFLLGHLLRDGARGDVYAEVTEHVPARYAQSHAAKLVLTPATWRHVQGVIELRAAGELLLGWQHKHPFFCRNCPSESRERCAFRLPFYSREDQELHATCFPRAWTVGLLVSDHGASEPSVTCYGWRGGVIRERGFSVVVEETPANRGEQCA